MSNNLNNQFSNMNFNPNAQTFNPNAGSFRPRGGGRGGGRGGYQGNNYDPNYQANRNNNNNYYNQGGYNQGYNQQGGYNNQYNQYNQQQQYYQQQQFYAQQQQGQYQQQQQQQQQNSYQPNVAQNVASPEAGEPAQPVQQEQVQPAPVQQAKAVIQNDDDVPDNWDDEPTPAEETQPINDTPVEKAPESPTTSKPNKQAQEKDQQQPKEKKEFKQKEKEPERAKVTMKADAIPENMRKSDKMHLNVVFIGHVDAGKSTIGGQILKCTNMVDARTLEKFEREAKEKNRESWYLSWCLDQNQEERDKGKTVECGRAFFETDSKHFTILDAPGHKSFVANMIEGASQADVAVLVVSARKGEFEAGFEKGGQTQEHAFLVKTAGVKKLVILINKMDEQTVQWSKDRYMEICKKLSAFLLKKAGYKKDELHFLPASGQTGVNIKESDVSLHPWYKEKSLIDYLDALDDIDRKDVGAVRLPIIDRFSDMGLIIFGKLESGQVIRGQTYTLMPNKVMVKVASILSDETEVDTAKAGENVKLKITGVEEDDISPGFVLCSNDSLCHYSDLFDVRLRIMDLTKPLLAPGYSCMLHVHQVTSEVTVKTLICKINPKNGEKTKFKKGAAFLKNGDLAIVRMKTSAPLSIECFKDFERMGRVTLRDEGKTIAMGTIAKVVEQK